MTDELFEPLPFPRAAPACLPEATLSYWQSVWRRFLQHRLALASFGLLALVSLFALVGPWVSGYTYYETNLRFHDQPPSRAFWFGTDDLGRDVFTRVAYGARISLFVGLTAALIDVLIGIAYGGVAGYSGGSVDLLLMRLADILYAIPYLLVVILLTVVMGSGLATIVAAMTITGWIGMARMVRGEVVRLKSRPYVQAAIALGASPSRILFRHIIPNALGPIIVMMTFTVPTAIFTEAFLSFLGLGVQAPVASWGTMAAESLAAMRYYPWRLLFPAFFISVTMLAFYVIGDALRDCMDPRLR
jgi:oligopeptide transport system permease protein